MTKISLAFGTALTLLFASCGQKNFLTGNDDNQPSGAPLELTDSQPQTTSLTYQRGYAERFTVASQERLTITLVDPAHSGDRVVVVVPAAEGSYLISPGYEGGRGAYYQAKDTGSSADKMIPLDGRVEILLISKDEIQGTVNLVGQGQTFNGKFLAGF